MTSMIDGSRAAESFAWESAALPQASVTYCKFEYIGGTSYVWVKGEITNYYYMSINATTVLLQMNTGSPSTAVLTPGHAVGDVIEAIAVLEADGNVILFIRVNGGAVTRHTIDFALSSIPTAWSNTQLILGDKNLFGGGDGGCSVQQFKEVTLTSVDSAVDGTQDTELMAEMRGLVLDQDAVGLSNVM